jgi:hypothetical protein
MKVPLSNQYGSFRTENSPLDGNVEVGDVVKDELDNLFVLLLTDVLDEAGGGELGGKLVGGKSVLSEGIVEVINN